MVLRRFAFLLLSLFSGNVLSSCDILGAGPCLEGSGKTITQSRDLLAVTGVDIRLPGTFYVTYGASSKVKVETYGNLQEEIKVQKEGNNVVISSESCLEYSNNEATFQIELPTLDNVELKSSADVYIENTNSGNKLRLLLSGSGLLTYSGNTEALTVLHSGSGDITLTGSASILEITLSGSGRVQGFSFGAKNAKTVLAGAGYQQVWAKENLDVIITGSGKVYYRGNPIITKYIPGTGNLVDSN